MNMGHEVSKWSDRAIRATVEHFEEIARQGRLNMLSTPERAEYDAAHNEFVERELR